MEDCEFEIFFRTAKPGLKNAGVVMKNPRNRFRNRLPVGNRSRPDGSFNSFAWRPRLVASPSFAICCTVEYVDWLRLHATLKTVACNVGFEIMRDRTCLMLAIRWSGDVQRRVSMLTPKETSHCRDLMYLEILQHTSSVDNAVDAGDSRLLQPHSEVRTWGELSL